MRRRFTYNIVYNVKDLPSNALNLRGHFVTIKHSVQYSLHPIQSQMLSIVSLVVVPFATVFVSPSHSLLSCPALYLPRSQLRRGFSSLAGAVDGVRKGSFEVISLSLSCTQDDGLLSTVSSLARCAFNSNVPACQSNGPMLLTYW